MIAYKAYIIFIIEGIWEDMVGSLQPPRKIKVLRPGR